MALTARRHRLPLALFVALVVLAIIYNRTREDRWRPIPGGGEIRWVAVTHEGPGSVDFKTKSTILDPLRSHLGPRWSHFLGPAPMEVSSYLAYPQAVVVWFQIRNHPSGPWSNGAFQLVRGDRLDQGSFLFSAVGGIVEDENLVAYRFPDDCRTQPRFHIRYLEDAGTVDFDIANPLLHQPPPGK